MIITVDPSQSEDIAAFAMVKQYRMQALNVTLNGGTGSGAWQAVQGGEGYTQTVVTPVTGIELVYEDPNAIVSYTVENDDTSNYDTASDAGIILSSIEPTTNAWTYTCVFHADSVPVSAVDIDLLVYGNTARGTEQQGSPATAEEITAQVLAGLETRVTALEEEMPTKADDDAVVHKAGAETIPGAKTFTTAPISYAWDYATGLALKKGNLNVNATNRRSNLTIDWLDGNDISTGVIAPLVLGDKSTALAMTVRKPDETYYTALLTSRGYSVDYPDDIATIATLNQYTPMVRTTGNQTIAGVKTFTSITWATALGVDKGICGPTTAATGSIYLMATIDSLPSNEGCVFTIRGGLNNQNHIFAKYRIINASSGGLAIEAIEKAYTSPYQKPYLYVYNDGGAIKIYGTTLSWTTPRLFLDYWETQGYMYIDLNRHTLTVSSDFSTVTLPEGATAEVLTYPMANTVHKTGDETLEGVKTFTSTGFTHLDIKSTRVSGNIGGVNFVNGNGISVSQIYGSADGPITINLLGTTKYLEVLNQRAYSAGNTNDVATIGTLDAYTPMVRTTGNQDITGAKTFTGGLVKAGTRDNAFIQINDAMYNNRVIANQEPFLKICDSDGAPIGYFAIRQESNSKRYLRLILLNSDNSTYKTITIGEND